MESDDKKPKNLNASSFTPLCLLPTISPEKHLQQPTNFDLLALQKKSSAYQQFESSFYYDDDNSSSFPPTYDSIFGQFKDENETKADSLKHLKTVLIMFAGQSMSFFLFYNTAHKMK